MPKKMVTQPAVREKVIRMRRQERRSVNDFANELGWSKCENVWYAEF